MRVGYSLLVQQKGGKPLMGYRTAAQILMGIFLGSMALCCAAPTASGDPSDYLYYTARRGDTLQSVSRQYRVWWKTIARLNGMHHPYRLSQGQVLKIPKVKFRIVASTAADAKTGGGKVVPVTFFPSLSHVQKVRSLLAIDAPELLHWRYIVIHHSATPYGNARSFNEYHKRHRHMSHGLAYHFVINNGRGGGIGQVEVGQRWKEQWPGGHTANRLMNEIGIGICVVGNYEKTQPPRQQIESLVILCKLLQEMCGLAERNIIPHRQVAQRGTLCPGRKFPWEKFRKMLLGTRLPEK